MSKFLTNAAVIDFDNEVKHEYQAADTLRNCVSLRSNVTGESYKFTRMGAGIANQKATQADVTPMDISHGRQTAVLENWNAPEYTDIFDQAEVNFDEKSELAKTIAKALGRREDQIIIDAMAAGSYSATPSGADQGYQSTIAGAMTVQQLRETALIGLTKRSVDMSDRTIAVTAEGVNQLLATTPVTSSDYNTVKTLVNGEIDTFLGLKFKVIASRDEGGLPGDGTATCSAFVFQKASVGYAVGIDMKTTIDWVAQKTSWLCNGMLKAGAVIRENAGVARITFDATVNPAQS